MGTTQKNLDYYRKNAEEDYLTTPISVLRYISEMESALRQPPVSGSLLTDDIIIQIAYKYASQYYSKDANPISHESLTEPFIDGFKKAMELIINDH